MLEDNSNLAAAGNSDGETALHVLARNPSAFVSEIRPCEFLFFYFILFFIMWVILTEILRHMTTVKLINYPSWKFKNVYKHLWTFRPPNNNLINSSNMSNN